MVTTKSPLIATLSNLSEAGVCEKDPNILPVYQSAVWRVSHSAVEHFEISVADLSTKHEAMLRERRTPTACRQSLQTRLVVPSALALEKCLSWLSFELGRCFES